MNVPQTNILANVIAENTPITQTIVQQMSWYPRPPPKNLAQRARVKTPWSWFKSVFKDYRRDTPQMLDDWFEFDWSMCKLPRIIKSPDELEAIKAFLKQQYKGLRELYKYYAAVSPTGLIFSIGNNVFSYEAIFNLHFWFRLTNIN